MKQKKIFIVILFAFSACLASQESPIQIDNYIQFPNKYEKILLNNNDIFHIYPKQKRLIFIEKKMEPNFSKYFVDFYDFTGKKIVESSVLIGSFDFLFLEDKSRFLAGQVSLLTKLNTSYLYDLDGTLIKSISHDYETKEIGVTTDNEYFWFVSNKLRKLKDEETPFFPLFKFIPYNHLLIFDVNAGELKAEYAVEGTSITIEINGKQYLIVFSPADIPG